MERISELLSAVHSQVKMAAICIQKFVSSLVSASHDIYRTLLRPSSITKPRYPLLSVVCNGWRAASSALYVAQPPTSLILKPKRDTGPMRKETKQAGTMAAAVLGGFLMLKKLVYNRKKIRSISSKNDPAAGSPTATLLRLLPLLDREYRQILDRPRLLEDKSSKWLYSLPITGNDGRCVQEPGTYSVRSDETRLQDIPCSWRIIAIINPHHDSGSKDSPDPSAQAARRQMLVG